MTTLAPTVITVHYCPACGHYEAHPDSQPVCCPRCLTPNPTPVAFCNASIEGER